MTRKHYQLLADVLKIARTNELLNNQATAVNTDLIIQLLATELQKDNKAFNKDLFFKNCGLINV